MTALARVTRSRLVSDTAGYRAETKGRLGPGAAISAGRMGARSGRACVDEFYQWPSMNTGESRLRSPRAHGVVEHFEHAVPGQHGGLQDPS